MKTLPRFPSSSRAQKPPLASLETSILPALVLIFGLCGFAPWGNAAELELTPTLTDSAFELEWVSVSLTTSAPYRHNEFELFQSTDLTRWTLTGPRFSGGDATQSSVQWTRRFPLSEQARFFRLIGTFQQAGANLTGVQLNGADLSGANLAGANLSNANLTGAQLVGADLTRAILSGASLGQASFAGANLDQVDLNNLDLQGVNLSDTIGTPVFNRLAGTGSSLAGKRFPDFPRSPSPSEFDHNAAVFAGKGFAKQLALVTLKTNSTVEQVNSFLAKYHGSIFSSRPQSSIADQAFLLVRFPTQSAAELQTLSGNLRLEPGVATAIPDIELRLDVRTQDLSPAGAANSAGTYLDWAWDGYWAPGGGNWGLEWCRVPEMWNFGEAIQKAGNPGTPTLVLDGGFPDHPDLTMHVINPSRVPQHPDHGMHVAGIIGARYGNKLGIDGVNPFVVLRGFSFDFPTLASFYNDVISGLTLAPDTKIISISIGFAWSPHGVPLTPAELTNAQYYAETAGAICNVVAISNPNRLFVCSAGNDYGTVPAGINSPWGAAADKFGAANVLLIGSFSLTGSRSAFSNPGENLLAPGEDILSLDHNGGYAVMSGTSMATPFVSGLAGFLWTADPGLSVPELRTLLGSTGNGYVDAYTSLLSIDSLPGRNKKILRGILDIDDGTPDGMTRIEVPSISSRGDRNFERVARGTYMKDFAAGNKGFRGDGLINMADFRTWRDWLIDGEEWQRRNHSINGAVENPKLDANEDGVYDPNREIQSHPRGDFNGDGVMSRADSIEMAGPLGTEAFTDLEVLQASGLWSDPFYEVTDLDSLVDSVDLILSAKSLFLKEPGFDGADVWVRDAASGAKLLKPIRLRRTNDTQIVTVPVGREYLIASDPVPLDALRFGQVRSIGTLRTSMADRCGDFVVDLTLLEMTARFSTESPHNSQIQSDPRARQVAALIPELVAQDPTGNPPEAYANDQATLYCWAKSTPFASPPADQQASYTGDVTWRRSFTKLPGVAYPRFHIKPIRLRLADQSNDTNELSAETYIQLERRVGAATNATWRTLFMAHTRIAGIGPKAGSPNTFEVKEHEGGFPDPVPTFETDVFGRTFAMTVEFPDLVRRIDLSDLEDGASFELRYLLKAVAVGPVNRSNPCDGDCSAEAYVGDPLSYGSGLTMRYGDFGGLFELQELQPQANHSVIIPYSSSPDFYFVLYRTNSAARTESAIAVQRGTTGTGTFIDPNSPASSTLADYRLLPVPLDRPIDVDGDGVDDLYEMARPNILNALDPSDANADPDRDGFTNVAEYQNGTDPEVPDAPPTQETGFYPGAVRRLNFGSPVRLEDVNGDGRKDLVSIQNENGNILVQLGNPDETFQDGIESQRTATFSSLTDLQVASLDGDAHPDLVITSLVEQRAYLYGGDGTGRFQYRGELVTGANPVRVLPLHLNSDAFTDLVILNERSQSLSRFLGQANGTFNRLSDLPLTGVGLPHDLASADVNQDGQADLVIVADLNFVLVLLGKGNGDFESARVFHADAFPTRVAVGDLNGDGRADIAITSSFQNTLSVLFGQGGGNFSSAAISKTVPMPQGLVIQDVNGDGRGDLWISHGNAVTTLILGVAGQNLGSSTLFSASTAPTPILTDVNGDSFPDLWIGTTGEYTFAKGLSNGSLELGPVLYRSNTEWTDMTQLSRPGSALRWVGLNRISNTLDIVELPDASQYRVVQSVVLTNNLERLEMRDVNGDGIQDAIVLSSSFPSGFRVVGTNRLSIVFGGVEGTFGNMQTIPLAEASQLFTVADVDGDRRQDFVVMEGSTSQLTVFLQQPNGSWRNAGGTPITWYPSALKALDLEGDGREELLAQAYGEDLRILRWDGTRLVESSTVGGSAAAVSTLLRDEDGDGAVDVLSVQQGETESTVVWYRNQQGTFAPGEVLLHITDPARRNVFDLYRVDVNQDGRPDLILTDGVRLMQIFPARAAGGFEPSGVHFLNSALSSLFRVRDVFWLDATGDGAVDAITLGGGEVHILPHR